MRLPNYIFILIFLILGCEQQKEHSESKLAVYFTYPGIHRGEDENPEQQIIKLINSLTDGDTLLIAMYTFTDDDIGDAVVRAKNRGVYIEVYLEESNLRAKGSEAIKLLSAEIKIFVSKPKAGLMHHKFAVINSEIVITGSYNWTASADERNWEDLLIIEDKAIAQKYKQTFTNFINNYAYRWFGDYY